MIRCIPNRYMRCNWCYWYNSDTKQCEFSWNFIDNPIESYCPDWYSKKKALKNGENFKTNEE